MPPPTNINVSVIVFDLFSKHLEYLMKDIFLHMSIYHEKHKTALVALHAADAAAAKFKNTKLLFELVEYDLDLLKDSNINILRVQETDWVNGVLLGLDVLNEFSPKAEKIHNKQIIIISDMKHGTCNTETDGIIVKLNRSDIALYIIGPEVSWTSQVKLCDDFIKAKNIMYDDNNRALKSAVDFVQKCKKGIIAPSKNALDVLLACANPIPKQPWNVPLTFNENFWFNTTTKRIVIDFLATKPKSSSNDDAGPKEYQINVNQTLQDVNLNNITRACVVENKIIDIPEDIKNSFKPDNDRMFQIIGFIDAKDYSELYMAGGEAHIVEYLGNNEFYNQFVEILRKQEKYAIALRAYNKGNSPKHYVLLPQRNNQLLMVPQQEIIKEIPKMGGSVKGMDIDQNLVDAFDSYLDEITCITDNEIHPHAHISASYYDSINKIRTIIDKSVPPEKPKESEQVNQSENLKKLIALIKSDQPVDTLDDNLDEAESNW